MEPEQRHAREVAADESGYVEHSRAAFRAGWDAAVKHLSKSIINEDYYTLAQIRLASDVGITEYGTTESRLLGIRDLIDKKRPELKPQ